MWLWLNLFEKVTSKFNLQLNLLINKRVYYETNHLENIKWILKLYFYENLCKMKDVILIFGKIRRFVKITQIFWFASRFIKKLKIVNSVILRLIASILFSNLENLKQYYDSLFINDVIKFVPEHRQYISRNHFCGWLLKFSNVTRYHLWGHPNITNFARNIAVLIMVQFVNFMLRFMVTLFCSVWFGLFWFVLVGWSY